MINFNVTGATRKELVQRLGFLLGVKPKYCGMPTAAYIVGTYTVNREGIVDGDLPEDVLAELAAAGFTGEESKPDVADDTAGIVINVPANEKIAANFMNMTESKSLLIQQAFGLTSLPVEYEAGEIHVRWFEKRPLTPEETDHAMRFIAAMVAKAGEQERVSAKVLETDNPRYSFRVFLNALGLKGEEHKTLRKELLKDLPGSAAFRHPTATAHSTEVSA